MVLPTLGLAGLGIATRGPGAALAIVNADYGTGIRVAAPASLLAHLAKAAKEGIIVKKGSALEILPNVDTFIFDKTGTLTREVPEVAEVIPAGELDEKKILWYAAAAEQYFTHPIAQAILAKAKELNIQLPKISTSAYRLGFGIQVTVSGDEIKVGSARYMKNEGVDIPAALEKKADIFRRQGGLAVYVSVNGVLAGVVGLKSSYRLEAYGVVQQLKEMGKEVVLISGDHEEPTRILAAELGINAYYAEILPHQKAGFIKMLQARGKKVAMVGDGVNDGPALSVADVSISLRGASDVAVDAADIVFMDGSLTRFEPLFRTSQEFQGNVKRSWYLILVPNTLCILGALMGVVGLGISLLLNNVFNFAATLNAMTPMLAV
jgi:Cu2+-exporting ATPase